MATSSIGSSRGRSICLSELRPEKSRSASPAAEVLARSTLLWGASPKSSPRLSPRLASATVQTPSVAESSVAANANSRHAHTEKMNSSDAIRAALIDTPAPTKKTLRRMMSLPAYLTPGSDGSVSPRSSLSRSPSPSLRTRHLSPPRLSPRRAKTAWSSRGTETGSVAASTDGRESTCPFTAVIECKPARLRGSAQGIGERGRSSAGIPWRSLPSYNSSGTLKATGDLYAAPGSQHAKIAVAMNSKRRGQFSSKFSDASDVILETVEENCENISLDIPITLKDHDDSMDYVKVRPSFGGGSATAERAQRNRRYSMPSNLASSGDSVPYNLESAERETRPMRQPRARRASSPPAQLMGGYVGPDRVSESPRPMQGVMPPRTRRASSPPAQLMGGYLGPDRESESPGPMQGVMLPRSRRASSPAVQMTGGYVSSEVISIPESADCKRVTEATRNWTFHQEMETLRTPTTVPLSRSQSARRFEPSSPSHTTLQGRPTPSRSRLQIAPTKPRWR